MLKLSCQCCWKWGKYRCL